MGTSRALVEVLRRRTWAVTVSRRSARRTRGGAARWCDCDGVSKSGYFRRSCATASSGFGFSNSATSGSSSQGAWRVDDVPSGTNWVADSIDLTIGLVGQSFGYIHLRVSDLARNPVPRGYSLRMTSKRDMCKGGSLSTLLRYASQKLAASYGAINNSYAGNLCAHSARPWGTSHESIEECR